MPSAGPSAVPRRSLAGLGRQALAAEMAEFGAEPFRVRQLWHWIYHRGATDFAAMTSLSKAFRERLAERYELRRPIVAQSLVSNDGTRKWLVQFADGQEVETVYIPEADRGTLCVSSQVGCTLSCSFCHTGTQRLVRNLSPEEIVGQVFVARDALDEWPSQDRLFGAPAASSLPEPAPLFPARGKPGESRGAGLADDRPGITNPGITNIVLMGMGEPLYNYENVAAALKTVMDPEGLSISRRKITLSTAGVVPMIGRCGAELSVNLAISLHAVSDDLRDRVVPLNRKYPIAELLDACRAYPGAGNARRITFEYVMLKGVNDSPAEARELVRLLSGMPAKVNLIPFNPWPGAPYECSTEAAIATFSDIVFAAGYSAPVRTPRGRDILAACGQLKSASLRRRRGADPGCSPPLSV
jgi:23S rRNA (adenine2503-C2)-methyltransferase